MNRGGLYPILERCLKTEKDLASVICVANMLEQYFSEEKHQNEKYVVNEILLALKTMQNELHGTIQEFDKFIVESKC